jgi:phosphomannomutase
MPFYENTIREAIRREVMTGLVSSSSSSTLPLAGLRIVLNAGNGSGSFFYPLLHDLGADVSSSIHCNPQQPFPTSGVPNPEYKPMIDETIQACEASSADLGIMLDTDADRCGLIVPRTEEDSSTVRYESLNRNRLIALLSVIFSSSSPGCTVVTDSVTSQGLSTFLHNLGLKHVRYLKGYANVIGKAKELMAEMAIETSGHCAMRENGYLDDGTYTAVKVIGLLARVSRSRHDSQMSHALSKKRVGGLLNLIENLEEMPEVKELRMKVVDGTTESTDYIYRVLLPCIQDGCSGIKGWELDKENLEGIRVTVGIDGSFFMLRKSLHDPILSLQVEGESVESVRINIIQPLLHLFRVREQEDGLDVSKVIQLDALRAY